MKQHQETFPLADLEKHAKVCLLCGALNEKQIQYCFNCGWHSFETNPLAVQIAVRSVTGRPIAGSDLEDRTVISPSKSHQLSLFERVSRWLGAISYPLVWF